MIRKLEVVPPPPPVAEFTTEGYPWEMFTAKGNAACSQVAAQVASASDRDAAVAAFSDQVTAMVRDGHREVTDTEPLSHFQDFFGSLCEDRGWEPVNVNVALTPVYSVLDQAARDRALAVAGATSDLIRQHQEEFDRLVAERMSRT